MFLYRKRKPEELCCCCVLFSLPIGKELYDTYRISAIHYFYKNLATDFSFKIKILDPAFHYRLPFYLATATCSIICNSNSRLTLLNHSRFFNIKLRHSWHIIHLFPCQISTTIIFQIPRAAKIIS